MTRRTGPGGRPGPTYWTGRLPTAFALVAITFWATSYFFWRHGFALEPVAGGTLRALPASELAAVVAAPLMTFALTPRLTLLDLSSPRRLGVRAALAGLAVVVILAVVPLATIALTHRWPGLMPPGTLSDVSTEDRSYAEIYTTELGLSITLGVVLVASLALLAFGAAGPVWGGLLHLALVGSTLFLQGAGVAALFVSGAGDPPYAVSALPTMVVGSTAVLGVASFALSRGGAEPVVRRLVRRFG
ncbi:hypothetical protein [Salana multivorans]